MKEPRRRLTGLGLYIIRLIFVARCSALFLLQMELDRPSYLERSVWSDDETNHTG